MHDPDLRSDLAALKRRFRLQMLVTLGLFVCGALALGGADALATAAVRFVEADAWKVASTNTAGTATLDRMQVTGGADVSRIKIVNCNVELWQQPTAPPSPNPGSLWYDSSTNILKYRTPTAWIEVSGGGGGGTPHALVRKPSDESVSNSSTLQDDDHLRFTVGANEKWVADIWVHATAASGKPDIKFAVTAPSGAALNYWVLATTQTDPSGDLRLGATASGAVFPGGIEENENVGFLVHVSVSNGSTAGDVRLQWAQDQDNSIATTVKAGSSLEATKLP